MDRLIQKHPESDDNDIGDKGHQRTDEGPTDSQGKSITENTSRDKTYVEATQPVAQADPD